MIQENLHTGPEVRTKLGTGIRKIADAVGGTMGTGGSNAIIEAIESPGHFVSNDGYSIANSVMLEDPIENMGKNILLEAINRANKQSGDGSSTTTVVTAATIEEGEDAMKPRMFRKRIQPMDIKRSLEECIPVIDAAIDAQKRDITVDEVGMVATISAEDPQIGATIQEIYQQIGKEGIVHWDISKTSEDSYAIGTGITVEGATYASPYMCDADEAGRNTNQIRLKNPKILITKQKLTTGNDLAALGAALMAKEVRDLIVFCDEFEPLMVNDLILTRAKRGFRFVLVKMPTLWKDEWYEDLALASGAKVVDPAAGFPLKDAKVEDLGTFGNITITKEQTFIDGIEDLTDHINALKEGDDSQQVRAARLNTKTARYFVGAHSDSALSYRRLKVEDAISAAWQALQGGIVIGGGLAAESSRKPSKPRKNR
jgi:chaperonin GroEL